MSVDLRIEVHSFCLHWEMKEHGSCVNLGKRFSKIYMRSVSFHFSMQTKKCTSILIFILKQQIIHKKSKNQCQFFRHMIIGIHWKIFAQFSYASLQAIAMTA